jgi:dipeptidyl-peptidase-4
MPSIKTTSLLLLAGTLSLSLQAQNRRYTMAEATNGMTTTLAPQSLKQAAWKPGTHRLYYRDDKKELKFFFVESSEKMQLEEFNCLNQRTSNNWVNDSTSYMQDGDTLNIFRIEKYTSIYSEKKRQFILPTGTSNLEMEGPNGNFAFTVKNNLYLGNYETAPVAITHDDNINIVNGQAVHRNEFGIDKGIFFSPSGNLIAYYRMDQTMVKDYPVIDWSVTPAVNENVKYPMAGDKSHHVTLLVYNTKTGGTLEILTEGELEQYLTCVTWSPDEKSIFIGLLNRDQNDLMLNQYDAATGKLIRNILHETSDKYVEPQHPLSFIPGSTSQFIWWSQRDGFMQLWLVDMTKNIQRCLTPGNYVVNELLGFNTQRKEIIFTSSKEDPREKHGYALNWKSGKMRRLDTEPGTHNFILSDDGAYALDIYTGKGVAKRSIVRAIDGSSTKVLIDAPNTLAQFERPQIIDTFVTSADGSTRCYGKLILPTKFDASKKYPVIVYLYNGPHVQLIKNGFPESGNLWYEYLAQHGYVVWTMDGRGSANRGLAFEQAVFRHLGTAEMDDQLKGVEFLKTLPYVDASRMGVHGWSFGGFMTTSLMLRHPGVFKVAVAGGPVMDWRMYEVMYGERYMDSPQDNPDGYKENALYDKVSNLKGKLLVIHGAQDATVVWQQSMKFIKACVSAGIPLDYFVYPGHEHNVRGKDRVHLMQKVTDYFDQNL